MSYHVDTQYLRLVRPKQCHGVVILGDPEPVMLSAVRNRREVPNKKPIDRTVPLCHAHAQARQK
jgi:hypothetical protein